MSQRASDVGELAVRVLRRRGEGRVTRLFQSSAYLRSGDDFVLLLWGRMRSPMTVNVRGGGEADRHIGVGESCSFDPEGVRLGGASIETPGARVFRSSLRERRVVSFASADALVKGVAALKSLYDVSEGGPLLSADPALREFVERVVGPLAAGETKPMFGPESYLPLIGRGGGFTPAGDDFVGGFLAAYNYVARCRGSKQVSIPRGVLFAGTIPESAAILGYSARGYLDEGLEGLILKSLGRKDFLDDLFSVARRGHTSGIDMSLGVLLAEAAISDSARGGGALKECLAALWNR